MKNRLRKLIERFMKCLSKYYKYIQILIFLLAILYVVKFLKPLTSENIEYLMSLPYTIVILVVLLNLMIIFLFALRWKLLLGWGISPTLFNIFNVVSASNVYGFITPGKSGDLMRTFFIRKYGLTEKARVVKTIVLEKFVDFFFLLAVGAYSTLKLFPQYGFVIAVFFLISFLVIIIYFIIKQNYSKSELRWGRLLLVLVTTTGIWFITGYQLYILISTLKLNVAFYTAFMIMVTGALVGSLTLMPGGIGTKDITMIFLFKHIGLAHALAVLYVLIFRLLTTPVFIMWGLVVLLVNKEFKAKQEHN